MTGKILVCWKVSSYHLLAPLKHRELDGVRGSGFDHSLQPIEGTVDPLAQKGGRRGRQKQGSNRGSLITQRVVINGGWKSFLQRLHIHLLLPEGLHCLDRRFRGLDCRNTGDAMLD